MWISLGKFIAVDGNHRPSRDNLPHFVRPMVRMRTSSLARARGHDPAAILAVICRLILSKVADAINNVDEEVAGQQIVEGCLHLKCHEF